ncbi:hypothetical protein CANCADRAFT_464 [Tortispora caseinolytica NRRL Y-17796]|uniref:Ribosomal protein L1 n=1 Tax=Tortispora caseinolytica NRRL Y-17796 TaxID=767744 RepID=A0A1E4TJG1_9ASCO|nr:hypothetical protein CANCADRAFT_464 [Tortispora caseinolytica NRRL Y-17796]
MEEERVAKAVTALLKHLNDKTEGKKPSLLGGEERVHVVITTNKFLTDKKEFKPKKIDLKHPISEEPEICIFVKDPQREYKNKLGDKVNRVVGVSKLKGKFKSYEARRLLRNSFDLFLADDRIVRMLPKLLGRSFYGTGAVPVPVSIDGDFEKKVEKLKSCTFVTLAPGTCLDLRVGTTEQNPDWIVDNIISAVNEVTKV